MGHFSPLSVVEMAYIFQGFRMDDLMSHEILKYCRVTVLWSELLRRNIENWAEFWCFRRFLWLSFFFNLSAAFSVDFNCYEQLLERINSFVSYFYLRWRNFSIVIPRSNKKNWVFLQTFESNVSFSTRCSSELGLEFAIRWEREKIFRKKTSERVELFFFKSRRFSKLNNWLRSILFAK